MKFEGITPPPAMLVMCRFLWPSPLSANLSVSDFATVSAVMPPAAADAVDQFHEPAIKLGVGEGEKKSRDEF